MAVLCLKTATECGFGQIDSLAVCGFDLVIIADVRGSFHTASLSVVIPRHTILKKF